MHKKTYNTFLALGFPSDLIYKIGTMSMTVSGLKDQTVTALIKSGFSDTEAKFIHGKINRKPIKIEVVQQLLDKSGGVCVFCADGNSIRPYQIHHIQEYHTTQDNSEDNLLLVCPTHHVNIHRNKIKKEEQLSVKRKWEYLWEIAVRYRSSGTVFPFSSFEFIDYKRESEITEIFSLGSPSPAVSTFLCKGNFASEAAEILQNSGKLILAGSSGSGKTTMALGIAGIFKERSTFRAITNIGDSIQSLQNILYFLSEAVHDVTLIVDDANAVLQPAHIELLLSSASASKWIIIINTRNDFVGNSNLEQHFFGSVLHLDWDRLKESVKESILTNEVLIVEYLRDQKINDHFNDQIGFSDHSLSLKKAVNAYLKTADTVWQFIFLLGGGISTASKLQFELRDNDRFDIVFFYIAMKQISSFEIGRSIEELLELYNINNTLSAKGVPEKQWLTEQLEELCIKRVLKKERGRYRTIHRQFGRKYIENFYILNPLEAEDLLDMVFKKTMLAKEIIVLLSWLRLTKVSPYLKKWYNPRVTSWSDLIDNACDEDLEVIGLFAEYMHIINPKIPQKVILDAFKTKIGKIAQLINLGKSGTIRWFYEIVLFLHYHANDLLSELIISVDKDIMIGLIKDAEPHHFFYLDSLFYKINLSNEKWIITVAKELSFADLKSTALKVTRGDVDTFFEILSFYRNYVFNFHKRHLRYSVDVMKKILEGSTIEEMNIPIFPKGLYELMYYESYKAEILSILDIETIATQLQSGTPRHWKKAATLNILLNSTESDVIRNIVDTIDSNLLIQNIKRYYKENLYEFRVLIYLLNCASTDVKGFYAEHLHPLVEDFYGNLVGKEDHSDVLRAYSTLDIIRARQVAEKYKLKMPSVERIKKSASLIKKIENLENSGKDYKLDVTRVW
jgi:energy-coupling factor transporter ATP-binding protein EcfA2